MNTARNPTVMATSSKETGWRSLCGLERPGESLDRLFASVYYLRPVSGFREEVVAALPSREADKLIELCQTTSAPRVSFETAQSKTS